MTLGLGFPWMVVRNQKFVTDNLVLSGKIELNRIAYEKKASEGAKEKTLDDIGGPISIG